MSKQSTKGNGEGMFNTPAFYRRLRSEVVPLLKTYPSVRIWDAGSRTSEDLFSIVILLYEEGLEDKFHIYATQKNERLLQRLSKMDIPLSSMKGYRQQYRRAGGRRDFDGYFSFHQDRATLDAGLSRQVSCFQHDLSTDESFNEFQMILCHRTIIGSPRTFNVHAHRVLMNSLSAFGVLGLDRKEWLDRSAFKTRFGSLDGGAISRKKVASHGR